MNALCSMLTGIGLVVLPLSASASHSGLLPEEMGIDLCFAWDSRYVSEGRDNLGGDGLLGTTLDTVIGGLVLGSWYAGSDSSVPYTEWNGYAAYNTAWRGIEAYVGYTHLRFISDDAHDNEVGAGVAYIDLPWNLAVTLDGYHSFESDGAFFEVGIGGTYELGGIITLTPSAGAGFNAGYVPDGHTGANHAALSLEAAARLKEQVWLSTYIAHTWSIDADPANYAADQMLDDFLYGGVAIVLSH